MSKENTTIQIKKGLRDKLAIMKIEYKQKHINDVVQKIIDKLDKKKLDKMFGADRNEIIDSLIKEFDWDESLIDDSVPTSLLKKNLIELRSNGDLL